MKGHWLDPGVLPMMKLVKLCAEVGPLILPELHQAYDVAAAPCSLASTTAAFLKGLEGHSWAGLAH